MQTGLLTSAVWALFCHSFVTVISGLGTDKVLRLLIRYLWNISYIFTSHAPNSRFWLFSLLVCTADRDLRKVTYTRGESGHLRRQVVGLATLKTERLRLMRSCESITIHQFTVT